jgi:hypothetical protein
MGKGQRFTEEFRVEAVKQMIVGKLGHKESKDDNQLR